MCYRVLEIQPTPNPQAVKFILDRLISDKPKSFFSSEAAKDDVIASQLFKIEGVTCVLLLGGFITINKRPEVKWAAINGRVEKLLSRL